MRSKTKWLMIGLGVSVVLATGMQEPARAEYVQSGPIAWTVKNDPADSNTSTMEEYSQVYADAIADDAYCYCYVYAKSWAKGTDIAWVDASATAYWQVSWQWEGPPSTPPGGTLGWSISGDGRAEAWGWNVPRDDGSGTSTADASSTVWIARNTGTFYGSANASGCVVDYDPGDGELILSGAAVLTYPETVSVGFGTYTIVASWWMGGNDEDDVASGTSQVVVLGGTNSTASTLAYTASEEQDWEAYAYGRAWASAFFDAAFAAD